MDKTIISIIGTGGVGGYFGGKFARFIEARKLENYEIAFIARGEHLNAIRQNGLVLNTSEEYGLICKPTLATDDIMQLPNSDIIIISVKGYDLEDVLKKLPQIIKNDTVILPLLNGVDIYERIRKKIKTGIVLPACVYIGTHIEKPGVISQKGGEGRIIFGNDPNNAKNPDKLIELFNLVNIKYQFTENPYTSIWEKYIFISGFGLVTACYDTCLGEIMEKPEFKDTARQIMQEVFEIATAKGIKLNANIVEESLNKAGNFPYETTTSYHRDVKNKGKLNEGDLFGGTIIRLGEELGVSTLKTKEIYGQILRKLNK